MVKNVLVISFKAIVSIGLIWVALKSVDLQSAFDRARQVNTLMLLTTGVLLIFQAVLGGIRWYAVAKAIESKLSLIDSLRLFYIGLFFNQVLPGGTSGDLVRMFLSYRSGLTLRGSINGVMLERLITVVALVLLISLTQPFFSDQIDIDYFAWSNEISVFILVLMVIGIYFLTSLDQVPQRFKKWKLLRGLSYLGQDSRKIFLRPTNIFPIILLGLLPHINFSICAYSLAKGLGIPISLFQCLCLMPPIMLITTLPLSIGGWGIRENAIILGFGLIGVASDAALALSVLLGLIALVTALPGGLVWLLSRERGENVSISSVKNKLEVENL